MDPDKKLAAILKDCGLDDKACWFHKQSGKWILYHWACEIMADKKGIHFSSPQTVVGNAVNQTAVCIIGGSMGEKRVTTYGEAAPYNNEYPFPFAVAEKRAKDRVVLKLLELHGLAYSEAEADFEEKPKNEPKNEPRNAGDNIHGPLNITELKDELRTLAKKLATAATPEQLDNLLDEYTDVIDQCERDLPTWYSGNADNPGVSGRIQEMKEKLGV
jgi:hypothetical protein